MSIAQTTSNPSSHCSLFHCVSKPAYPPRKPLLELLALRRQQVLKLGLCVVCFSLTCSARAALSAEPIQKVKTKLISETDEKKHGLQSYQRLLQISECPEVEINWPKLASDRPLYFAAKLGDAEDETYCIVVDESGGPGTDYDVAYIDCNNDNKIDPEHERFRIKVSRSTDSFSTRIPFKVTAGNVTSLYHVDFLVCEDQRKPNQAGEYYGRLSDSSYYEGEAVIDGKRHTIGIADLSGNGCYNDFGPTMYTGDRIFIDLNDDGTFSLLEDQSKNESFPYCRYTRINDQWYEIDASPDGGEITIQKTQPALGILQMPNVKRAKLRSKTQLLDLHFKDGEAEAIVGQYTLHYLSIRSPVLEDQEWELICTFHGEPPLFKSERPVVNIVRGRPVKLEYGAPFKVNVNVLPANHPFEGDIIMNIRGRKNEFYRLRGGTGLYAAKPAILVIDPLDRPIAMIQEHLNVGVEKIWDIPMSLKGKYHLFPVIDLPGLEFKSTGCEIEIKQGKLVKE